MTTSRENNSSIQLLGGVITNPEFSHEVFGERFYTFMLSSFRTSGKEDILPVQVSERLVNLKDIVVGTIVSVCGTIRTYNKKNEQNNKTHLIIYVFADTIEIQPENSTDCNEVSLVGYLCKEPVYRKTPLGREICDTMIAVNRPYGKSDYIPCICWGRNAGWANTLEVGTQLKIQGRLQSRAYQKKTGENADGTPIFTERVAYELSVGRLEVLN